MSQLQGDSAPTTLADTGAMVHLALWSPLLRKTRCGIVFEGDAECVDEPVSCMTCLTRAEVFWIPLRSRRPNYFGECCWLKQTNEKRIAECCFVEDPCDYHQSVEP